MRMEAHSKSAPALNSVLKDGVCFQKILSPVTVLPSPHLALIVLYLRVNQPALRIPELGNSE